MPKLMAESEGSRFFHNYFSHHLLFVDDVIMFGMGSFEEWLAFKVILDTFCEASGMRINLDKSCFLHNDLDADLLHRITGLLPY